MDTITRFHLCLFPFDKNGNINKYNQNRAELYDVVKVIESFKNSYNLNNKGIVSLVRYNSDPTTYLTMFIHNDNIYLGIYDTRKQRIVFNDDTFFFDKIKLYVLANLEQNTKQEIANAHHIEGCTNKIYEAWLAAIPLIDAINMYETYIDTYRPSFKSLPEYNDHIDALIGAYESMSLEYVSVENLYAAVYNASPIFQAMCNTYGIGINNTGGTDDAGNLDDYNGFDPADDD